MWTALICADAEGLPWQPDLLLLLLPGQSQDRVLTTGATPCCLAAGGKPLVSGWPQDEISKYGIQDTRDALALSAFLMSPLTPSPKIHAAATLIVCWSPNIP